VKRIALLFLGAVVVVACQDSEPTRPPQPGAVSFAISDGASGGNPDFFFLPPLVEEPSENVDAGAFNEFLEPFVKFCRLDFPNPGDCTFLSLDGQDTFAMDLDGSNEWYKYNWKTSDFGLIDEQNYRIEVYVGSDALPDNRGRLGFRDVTPLSGPPVASCTTADPFCQFQNGSNIPIKVRIEDFAFCPVKRNCQTKFVDLLGGATSFTVGDNLLDIPQQNTLDQDGTVNFRECEVDVDDDPDIQFDLPTFGRCLETDILTPDFDPSLEVTAVISFCSLGSAELGGLSPAQQGLLKVHHFRSDDGGVEALREADNCPDLSSGLPSNPVLRLANRIGDRILTWVGVRPLRASTAVTHRDSGGNTLSTIKSRFKLALPAKIDFVDPADAERLAPAGSQLATRAIVTDLFGNSVAGATVRWNVLTPPAEGATVEGTVSPSTVLTGADGIAEVTWTLAADPGVNKLTAGGRGLADSREAGCETPGGAARNCNGPRDDGYQWGPFDPFQPIEFDELPGDGIDSPDGEFFEEIAEGTRILYTAIGCEPGFGTPTAIDGTLEAGEWDCALSQVFPVNLSGGSTVEATLYWMNDTDNFYLAVVVPGTGRKNSLRIEWDSDGDGNAGGRELGDDVWEFEPDDGPADKFIDEKCVGSSQSNCGRHDLGLGGDNQTEAAFNNTVGGETVYEMAHPLSTGDLCTVPGNNQCGDGPAFPIDLDKLSGQEPEGTAGFFLTLALGSGAQGNTQWPGFLDYWMITIK
jgi:hypothetical protein